MIHKVDWKKEQSADPTESFNIVEGTELVDNIVFIDTFYETNVYKKDLFTIVSTSKRYFGLSFKTFGAYFRIWGNL